MPDAGKRMSGYVTITKIARPLLKMEDASKFSTRLRAFVPKTANGLEAECVSFILTGVLVSNAHSMVRTAISQGRSHYAKGKRGKEVQKLKKRTIIMLLLCLLMGMAGCTPQQQAAPEPAVPPVVSDVAAPPDSPVNTPEPPPAAGKNASPAPAVVPAVKDNASVSGNGEVSSQAALVLGRVHDEKTNQITDLDNTFKAGEKFYYRFDNGMPFGVESILLQYEAVPSGEILNKYSITVNPALSSDWATISFKQPGKYKLVFMVNSAVRASADFTIE